MGLEGQQKREGAGMHRIWVARWQLNAQAGGALQVASKAGTA